MSRILIAPLLLLTLLSCPQAPPRCWVCEREVHPQVRASLRAGGDRIEACCMRCALHYLEQTKKRVEVFQVADYPRSEMIQASEAFFVEGSDETPCLAKHPVVDETRVPAHVCFDRCLPSLIAFRHAEEARAFVAEHGGALLPAGSLAEPSSSSP